MIPDGNTEENTTTFHTKRQSKMVVENSGRGRNQPEAPLIIEPPRLAANEELLMITSQAAKNIDTMTLNKQPTMALNAKYPLTLSLLRPVLRVCQKM